jgi:hypothetical protein
VGFWAAAEPTTTSESDRTSALIFMRPSGFGSRLMCAGS